MRRLVDAERLRALMPMPNGWEERSPLVEQVGSVGFRNVDLYAQALATLERGHDRDLTDVEAMISRNLVDPTRLRAFFAEIEPDLYRFPAIDPTSFRVAVEQARASAVGEAEAPPTSNEHGEASPRHAR